MIMEHAFSGDTEGHANKPEAMMGWKSGIREWIVRQKTMMLYGKDWGQFIALGWLVVDSLHKYWPFSEIGLIELMAIALIGMWATGFVLFKLGFFTSENDFRFKNSFLRKIDIDRDSDGKA